MFAIVFLSASLEGDVRNTLDLMTQIRGKFKERLRAFKNEQGNKFDASKLKKTYPFSCMVASKKKSDIKSTQVIEKMKQIGHGAILQTPELQDQKTFSSQLGKMLGMARLIDDGQATELFGLKEILQLSPRKME